MDTYDPNKLVDEFAGELAASLVSLMPAAVYTCDAEGRITFFNRRAAEMWGREPRLGDRQENYCGSFRMWTPDGALLKHGDCPMADALREGRSARNLEVVIEQPTGARLCASVNIDPITDGQGRVAGSINVFVDVTERKRNEVVLASQREALELALNGQPLQVSLGVLVRTATALCGQGARAAFYLVNSDAHTLRHVVGMSPEYAAEVDGFMIGPDSTACGLAAHTGEPVLTTDVREDPRWLPWLGLAERADYRGCWSFPVHSRKGEFVGTFALYWREPREAAARDVGLATLIVQSAAIIIARDSEARRRETAEAALSVELAAMRALHDLSTITLATAEVAPVLEAALEATMRLQAADFGNIQLYESATQTLRIAAQRGFEQPFLIHFARVDAGEGCACGLALASRQRKIITDVETDPDFAPHRHVAREAGFRAVQSTPLFTGSGEPLGMLSTHFRRPRSLTDTEQRLTDLFAREVARCIERVRDQAALRESEERFRQFAQASSGALWIRDAVTLVMEYVSPATARIYGVAPEAFLGEVKHWAAAIVPEDRGIALEHLERARRGEAAAHEFRIQRDTDQSFRWIRDTDFPLFDEHGRVKRIGGIAEDVTEAKLAVERQGILLAELQHRVRNIMAMIRSVAARTADSAASVEDYAALMAGRLLALARTQALITQALNVGVEVETLIRQELEAQAPHEGQYALSGPGIAVSPKAAEVLALAVHELTTNALKHGALSTVGGKISVAWQMIHGEGQRRLRLDWTESRPAPPNWTPPTHRGFGSNLVEQRVPYELSGRGKIEIRPEGARAWIEFPLQRGDSILETDAPVRASVFGGSIDMTGEPSLAGQNILVLEDDFYLAEDAAGALRGAGARVSGPFANEAAVLKAIEDLSPSAAVIDINLGSGASFKAARELRKAKTPILFLTGYDQSAIPAEFDGVVRLQKPVELREIIRGVAALSA